MYGKIFNANTDIRDKDPPENISNIPDAGSLDNLLLLIVDCLQPVRNYLNKPVIITSGYRCLKLNSHPAIRGAKTSQHIKGQAADFVVKGMTPKQVVEKVRASGVVFDQLINEYDRWTHISYNKNNNRRQILYLVGDS